MRNLQFQDLFKVIRILKKSGLSKQARTIMLKVAEQKAAAQANDSKDTPPTINAKELGMDFIFSVIENLGEAEDEFYSFFADLTGKTVDEIKKLELDEMVGMFEDFLKLPNLNNFFSKVSNMMK